jgi:hypothetical protein
VKVDRSVDAKGVWMVLMLADAKAQMMAALTDAEMVYLLAA